MKLYSIVSILLIAVAAKAQTFVLNSNLKAPYVQEVVLPVANNAYVLVYDSTAYLYNVHSTLPYITQNLKDSYILNTDENRLYSIKLVPLYIDQIDEVSEELTTLVTYVYEINYGNLESALTNKLVKQYGYLIPKSATPENFTFSATLNIEDTYTSSIYQDLHAAHPSHHLRIDKGNVLIVEANGDLSLSEVKNHKVEKEKKWTNFKGTINLISCVKIGDVVRVNFERYQKETNKLESFWSIINLKTQTFVSIDLKDFNANLKNLQNQDIALLNSIPFFYKAENESNIKLFVLPNANFVWLDDESYYYGSNDISKYATMQKDDKSYDLTKHSYLFNHPSHILRAIAPQKSDKIRALEEAYDKNKQKVILEHGNN